MISWIDGYSQVRIMLSIEEAQEFESKGSLDGEIQDPLEKMLPLHLKTSEQGWRAETIPVNAFYEKITAYEIDVPPDGPRKILDGRIIETCFPTIRLRMIYMSLDTVY